ncbi:MAG: hypothetical protein ACRDHF_06440 [Tepidiformaceae bacterium]
MTPRLEAAFRMISLMSDEDQEYWAERILDKIAELRAQGLTSPPPNGGSEKPGSA